MKLNAISALIMYQNIPLNCRRSYVTDIFFNASLNLFLSPDKVNRAHCNLLGQGKQTAMLH